MSLNANYQKLEPGDEVRLLEIDGQAFGLDEVLYFHGYNVLILQPKSRRWRRPG